MRKVIFGLLLFFVLTACAPTYVVRGPQGGIATSWTWPKEFNQQTDSCRMVILMHGIFSSKDMPPMPALAKELAKQGIASVAMDFGGHGKSEGSKQQMTIERELQEARALFDYVDSLPCVSTISLLGHSQGGVIASMLAGRLAAEDKAPEALVLLAPGSVIKEACQSGHFFRNTFDPKDPPEYIKCFGWYKVGREYMLTTQQLDIYGTSEQYQGPVCIIHGTKDGIVPLWCSERYDSIYNHSTFHLIEGENHLMIKHLSETKEIISDFLKK
ncbi:MAG: alpha/beta fold hydrolase [Paludibacteraceae bacterium]|nr:alpha/beta fold hydrolase [Paludibacteraceae bacterium]